MTAGIDVDFARKQDVPALARVLGRAFFDDPVMEWMQPHDKRRARALPRMFAAMVRHHFLAGGGVEVTSGKYLTDNVYLEVRSGAAGAPGLAIEWEPIENIEVEAATNTGEDQGQELSIQWTRDFDDPGSKKKD